MNCFGKVLIIKQKIHLLKSFGFESTILLFLIFLTVQFICGQDKEKYKAGEEIFLESGKTVERRFADGTEKHIYQISLSANQYANVIIEQRGVDIVARVSSADGKVITDIDSEMTAQGTEKIELVAETAGNYRIEIKPSLAKVFAGKYLIKLSEIREATADEKLLDEARRQYYQSIRLSEGGKFDVALELANHALETREKILGSSHADIAASLILLGKINTSKNNLGAAETFFHRAEEMTANIFGKDSLKYADALHSFARFRFFQGRYDEMRKLTEQSLAIREKLSGSETLAVAASLNNLAILNRAVNNYSEAEKNFLKVLAIREKLLGENSFDVAQILNDFGLFYYGAGDYVNASALLQRSLAVKEKMLPPNHRQIGIALNNLGLVAWKKKDYEKAKSYYLRALSIYESTDGSESDGVASISNNLGIIYKESDRNYAKAEEFYRRALAIWEKIYGENHASTANAVSSLGILYRATGDYNRAEQFQLRAQAIYQKMLGPYNHYTLLSLEGLIRVYVLKGDIKRAIEYQKKLSEIEEKVIPLNLLFGSERQKLAYYKQSDSLDKVITLQTELARADESLRDLAVTSVLQYKGRVLDALSENLSALRSRFNSQDQALLDKLNDINSRLSKLILGGREKTSVEEQQNLINALTDERDKLEGEISRQSSGFYQSSKPVSLEAVKSAVPNNGALVEFAVYYPFNWKAREGEKYYGEPRYIAYVIRPQNKVQWVELGKTQTLDASLDAYRHALRDPKNKDVRKLARAVDEKIMQPLRALLGDAKQVLISPDGALNLIPFESLVDEKGKYLVENYSFTYLTSGRDLLRMQTRRESKNKSLILANPTFGEQKGETNATRDASDTYFSPLGGTLQEARSIQTLFPDATVLTGAQATETALKQTNAPQILHIATHGFFLKDKGENDSAGDSQMTNRGSEKDDEIENPLLRSGLALAGANQREKGVDDGILTALEASGLNLWGTKLVVLSACDTGLGDVKNGEGVYGLRRAFVLAGTESLIMSLWSVSDYATRELMTNYYKNLKQGMGRGAALRQVQLEMLKRKEREHPFYWAAFIQSGEWSNLDGKR